LFVTVAGAMVEHHRQLDSGVEESGPHDFAVCGNTIIQRELIRA
jgi:hypothetical protein